MEYKINTLLKTVIITSNTPLPEFLKLIENLKKSEIIDDTWTIGTEPNFTYYPSYPTITPILDHSGKTNCTCNGTGCNCDCGIKFTTN